MGFDSPIECEINLLKQRIKTGNIVPSAATPCSEVKEMMGGKYDWTPPLLPPPLLTMAQILLNNLHILKHKQFKKSIELLLVSQINMFK